MAIYPACSSTRGRQPEVPPQRTLAHFRQHICAHRIGYSSWPIYHPGKNEPLSGWPEDERPASTGTLLCGCLMPLPCFMLGIIIPSIHFLDNGHGERRRFRRVEHAVQQRMISLKHWITDVEYLYP